MKPTSNSSGGPTPGVPIVPTLPTNPTQLAAVAAWFDDPTHLHDAFTRHAHKAAEQGHPAYQPAREAAEAAHHAWVTAYQTRRDAERHYQDQLGHYGSIAYVDNPQQTLDRHEHAIVVTQERLDRARNAISVLTREPAVRSLPVGALESERARWQHERAAATLRLHQIPEQTDTRPTPHPSPARQPSPPSRGIAR